MSTISAITSIANYHRVTLPLPPELIDYLEESSFASRAFYSELDQALDGCLRKGGTRDLDYAEYGEYAEYSDLTAAVSGRDAALLVIQKFVAEAGGEWREAKRDQTEAIRLAAVQWEET